MKTPCRIQTLASGGPCAVEYCPNCGVFHLKVGFATLNFSPEGFSALGATINTALARFRCQQQEEERGHTPEKREGNVFH